MKLSRQLELTLLSIFIIIYASTLWVNLINTQSYLNNQLQSHAQDTASFLGLTISRELQEGDSAALETLTNALFDRGDYKEISIEPYDKQTASIHKTVNIYVDNVPQWFIKLFKLDTPRMEAEVMNGWHRTAKVFVQSHPSYAYQVLWRTTLRLFLLYSALLIVLSILGIFVLRKLLKPLNRVVKQAEALANREYVLQEEIPKTPELKVIVEATNHLTTSIKNLAEIQARNTQRLKDLAYKDQLTGFYNRRQFEAQLKCNLLEASSEKHKGVALLIKIDHPEESNFESSDQLTQKLASILKNSVAQCKQPIIGRLSDTTFGILLPSANIADAEKVATDICQELPKLHTKHYAESPNVAHIGISPYQAGQDAHDVLADAKIAIREAKAKGMNTWSIFGAIQGNEGLPRHERMSIIAKAINNKSLVLFGQPVVDVRDKQHILHTEFFARIPGKEGQLQSAGLFIPIAEQVGLARELDIQALDKLIHYVNSQAGEMSTALNLSLSAFDDPKFAETIYQKLNTINKPNKHIIFEATEYAVIQQISRLKPFIQQLRERGHGFGIDNFGHSFTDFGYLHSLRPDYVKLDRSYTTNILHDADVQFFIDSIHQICHHQNIKVIAVGVERDDQWFQFRKLNIDAIQGFVISKPISLPDSNSS